MSRRLTAFLLLALLALFPLTAGAAQQNLLRNGDFEAGDQSWGYSAWNVSDVFTSVQVLPDGEGGGHCLLIESYEPNDARMVQTLRFEKNATYEISARMQFEGPGMSNLSLLDHSIVSPYVYDTGGEWVDITLYVHAGSKSADVDLALRLGYYGWLETGRAWFDDVAVRKVDYVPSGMVVHSLDANAPASQQDEAPDRSGLSALVFAALFSLAVLGVYSVAARAGEIGAGAPIALSGAGRIRRAAARLASAPQIAVLAGILLCAFVVRCYIAMKQPGYEVDINCFGLWGQHFLSVGPLHFYDNYFCDYPPGYLPVLGLLSAITQWLRLDFAEPAGQLILKLPPMLCDLMTCYLLYRIGARALRSAKWGLVAAALYAFSPAVLADSAAWGQIDSVLTLLIALSLYAMVQRRMMSASVFFCIGVLVKPQALMFGPILLLAFLHEIYENRLQGVQLLGKCFAVCAAIFIAVVLPFNGAKNPVWLIEKYFATMSSYQYASVNAMNLFGMIGGNWQDQQLLLGPLSWKSWGYIAMALSIAYAAFLYIYQAVRGGADRRALLISALVLLCGIFTFGVRMHERYLFPALAIALIAFLLYRDRRFLFVFLGLGAAQAINILVVLAHEHVLAEDRVLMLIGSALHILFTLYLLYLGFAICVVGAGKKREERFIPFRAPSRMVIAIHAPSLTRPGQHRFRLDRLDALLIAVVTLAYSLLAFTNLGDRVAPQTTFRSSTAGETVTVDLGEVQEVARVMYYCEIPDGVMELTYSEDGRSYRDGTPIDFKDNNMFKWLLIDQPERARYVRLIFDTAGFTLFEMAFTDDAGIPFPITDIVHEGARADKAQDPALLFDEQALVPEKPTYMNSMYFDEIYHARTAYEQIHDMPWYEGTHPPLGKVFMSWSIDALGMNAFAWRLPGTVAGILMLPGMYLLGKLLFRRREIAFASMFLMAADCMHLAQTRIATIDSFPVLFIIWAYFFMFLYANMSLHHDRLGRTLLPLLGSGICMGLACASKWIGFYAAAGLAVIFFYCMGKRFFEYLQARKLVAAGSKDRHMIEVTRSYWGKLAATLACCVLFFVVIPLGIYVGSYYQYLLSDRAGTDLGGVWKYQTYMLNYHSGVFDSHPYESTWYQWPLIWKPMAFYFDYRMPPGWSSSISTFGNPLVWWPGLIGILWMIWRTIRGDSRRDPRILLVVIGFAAQYLAWVLVPRTTYIYHYFASVPFIILCICFFLEKLLAKGRTRLVITYLVLAGLAFALFYPVASGFAIPIDFAKLSGWLPQWRLYWG